jgi:hypothetical protein
MRPETRENVDASSVERSGIDSSKEATDEVAAHG